MPKKTKSKLPDSIDRRAKDLKNHSWKWEYFATWGVVEKKITKRQWESFKKAIEDRGPNIAAPGHRGKRKITLSNGEKTEVSTGWPMKCEALAVHPRQVAQMNARNKRHGVNVSYDPKWGTAIVPDAGAYKRLQKLEGVRPN